MYDLFLLSARRMARISPHFLLSNDAPRVDDWRVVSGTVYIIRNGSREMGATAGCGPHKTLYNRFVRQSLMGVFGLTLHVLQAKDLNPHAS